MALRDLIKFLGPGWLVKDEIEPADTPLEVDNRVLYSIARVQDAYVEQATLGTLAAYPGGDGALVGYPGVGAPEDALPYLGRDAQIIRGPGETREQYEARLQRAKDDWQAAGISWTLLEQLRAYCTPHAVRVRVVNYHRNYYQIDRDGSRSWSKGMTWNWDNSPSTDWAQFWVHIYVTTGSPTQPWQRLPNIGDPSLWNNAIGSPGYTIGSTATPDDVSTVRSIVRTWKPEGSRCIRICVIFRDDAPAFELDALSPPAPDGQWGKASKNVGGVQVYSRSTDAIYWTGT